MQQPYPPTRLSHPVPPPHAQRLPRTFVLANTNRTLQEAVGWLNGIAGQPLAQHPEETIDRVVSFQLVNEQASGSAKHYDVLVLVELRPRVR
jgi:hypothetical protein